MGTNRGVILIVDDNPTNLNVLMEFLESSGYKVLVATDGESALEQAEYTRPDIILLDVMMPGMDGFETCQRLKASEATSDLPVIFMTALSDTVDKVRGFQLGAADYITKPLQHEEVVARVQAHLTLHRQKLEIEGLRLQEQLRYETLVQLKDEVLSTASHDLKNPIAAILASVDFLRRYISIDDPRIYRKFDQIEAEASFMRDLIVNLLDLARFETGLGLHKKTYSLQRLLEESIAHSAALAAEKGILIQYRMPDEDLAIYCDPVQISQVFQNLISNAIKYTDANGSIEVSAEVKEKEVHMWVTDTGIGIPEKELPYVFERFYRVNTLEHRQVTGTGLGLSIVREIVRQHGGSTWVKSQEGVGSTFSFTLPR